MEHVMHGLNVHQIMVTVTWERKMKTDKLCCIICGQDITRSMKIYVHGYKGGAYCYDCAEAEKKRLTRDKSKTKQTIKAMLKRGLKPSEIAENMKMSIKEVYEVLTT